MKIFEFRFNPGAKIDLLFNSFCYEPNSFQEKRLGSLYVIGELKNALPQNSRLLPNLALLLKREYYLGTSPEKSLKKALKKANDFLFERTKTGNVSWLGNLSVAVLSFHDFTLNFSKDGSLKLLLLRSGQVTDIGKSLEADEFEPYPLKIFTNIVGGKFLENDKVLIATKDVFDLLSRQELLTELSQIMVESKLKEFFRKHEKEFASVCGACILLFLTKTLLSKSELTFKKTSPPLSLKDVFSPLVRILPRFKTPAQFFSAFLSRAKGLFSIKLEIKKPSFSLPKLSLSGFSLPSRKKIILLSALFAVLFLGFLLSRAEENRQMNTLKNQLLDIQEKTVKAQGYLVLGQNEKAQTLFREAYQSLSELGQGNNGRYSARYIGHPARYNEQLKKEEAVIRNLLEKNLMALSKLDENPELELVFEFKEKSFLPQHLGFFENSLYFFGSYLSELAFLKGGELHKTSVEPGGVNLSASDGNYLYLFTRPNRVSVLKEGRVQESFSLRLPESGSNFVDLACFKDNLYFLEKGTGQIFRYQTALRGSGQPRAWFQSQEKKPLSARSFQVRGSVFVLVDDSVREYRAGLLQNAVSFSVFPLPKHLTKLVAVSPYFVILDTTQNRLIIADRQGKPLKQLKSDKFSGLKDAVLAGQNLYILSADKVYRFRIDF